MTVSTSRVTARILDLDRQLRRKVRQGTPNSWLDVDLSLAAIRTILIIDDQADATPGQIAETMGVGRTTITGFLDRLESEGLISRTINPNDRRSFLLTLTEKGKEFVYRIDGHRRDLLRRTFKHMSDQDLAALERGLSSLLSALVQEIEGREGSPSPAAII